MSDLVEEFESGVLTLTMNRPEVKNAMSGEMIDGLIDATRRAADDPAVRCVVVTGAGESFCSGGDVNSFGAVRPGSGDAEPQTALRVPLTRIIRRGAEIARNLHEMPKPTLAVIPGAAAGAGLSLALACDLRFCLDTAKLTTAFARIGASGDVGGSFFLPRLVGAAKARELYFLAEVISGREALEIGLVNRVADCGSFDDEARALAERLAGLPTAAIGLMKQNLNTADGGSMNEVFDIEASNMALSLKTHDHKAAARAFLAKEQAVFEGY